ncbi:MAG: glycosyltransferase family 4 protein [Phenylobacterium sp.]|uniref:glycosyltransferase family 4 protein n=1 Tax=Phenylobacterium sp. TaxID=1871053 RepID=UPI00391AD6AA
MASSLAVYLPAGTFAVERNPFGRTIANRELYRALVRHGGYDPLTFVTQEAADLAALQAGLRLEGALPASVRVARRGSEAAVRAASAGALLRGDPDLYDLAFERRRSRGDEAYSLVGFIHTLAPPAIRQRMATAAIAPTRPWDAQICTSPSVQAGMSAMYDAWDAYLADRFEGKPGPRPMLPVIPLGVDQPHFASLADRPAARAALRAELGLGEDDVLVLWVGRLSFFEKAYPQPMFRAIEEAARATGARVHFAMAGWFPNGDQDERRYRGAAEAYAPSVAVSFQDGNDRARVADLWAGADVFVSLVDNIQETFGLTPVEAMAAGLPVVVSDWDGYRFTVRDGETGFLIPTLGGPVDGSGQALAWAHQMLVETYQSYVGTVAQHTAVDVGRAAQALAELIRSPELRRRMGAAARAHAAATFDWPVVIGQVRDLLGELAAMRAAAAPEPRRRALNPFVVDPFRDFAGFPNATLTRQTRLRVRPGAGLEDLVRAGNVELDRVASHRRAPLPRAVHAFGAIQAAGSLTVGEVLARFPEEPPGPLQLTLIWMCKLGVLAWEA